MRHQEILRQEATRADAVILVVNARRPEDKSASMAYLLNQALLGAFTEEQKNYFAQKVFLIVNQRDAIHGSEDERRLQESIEELSRIIAPHYHSRHVLETADRRYFETIAPLANQHKLEREVSPFRHMKMLFIEDICSNC